MLGKTIPQKTTLKMYIIYTIIRRFGIRKECRCSLNFLLVIVSGPEIVGRYFEKKKKVLVKHS